MLKTWNMIFFIWLKTFREEWVFVELIDIIVEYIQNIIDWFDWLEEKTCYTMALRICQKKAAEGTKE